MQSVSSRNWTCVAVFISYDDNHYTTGTIVLDNCHLYIRWWILAQLGIDNVKHRVMTFYPFLSYFLLEILLNFCIYNKKIYANKKSLQEKVLKATKKPPQKMYYECLKSHGLCTIIRQKSEKNSQSIINVKSHVMYVCMHIISLSHTPKFNMNIIVFLHIFTHFSKDFLFLYSNILQKSLESHWNWHFQFSWLCCFLLCNFTAWHYPGAFWWMNIGGGLVFPFQLTWLLLWT